MGSSTGSCPIPVSHSVHCSKEFPPINNHFRARSHWLVFQTLGTNILIHADLRGSDLQSPILFVSRRRRKASIPSLEQNFLEETLGERISRMKVLLFVIDEGQREKAGLVAYGA